MTWEFADLLGRRLVAWGLFSTLAGVALVTLGEAFWRGFGGMAIAWGLVDTAIGLVARRLIERSRRRTIGDQPARDQAHRRIRRLLLLNAALDIAYIALGSWLVATAAHDAWRAGAGWGVIVQGGFLLAFDLAHVRLQPPRGPLLPAGLDPYRGPGHEAFGLRLADPTPTPDPVRGALLVHGFAGSPRQLRALAAALATDGWLVEVPRLPGHGTDVRDIAEYRVEDWVQAVEAAAAILREAGVSRLLVAGHSIGGSLALATAEHLRADALVLLAPFAWPTPGWQRAVAPVLRVFLPPGLRVFGRLDLGDPATRAGVAGLLPESDLDDPAVAQALRELRVPLTLLEQLFRISSMAIRSAPAIRVPVLAVQGLDDTVSRPDRTRALLSRFPLPAALVELPAGHDLVSETSPVRDRVLARVRAFAAGMDGGSG